MLYMHEKVNIVYANYKSNMWLNAILPHTLIGTRLFGSLGPFSYRCTLEEEDPRNGKNYTRNER